MGNVHPMKAVMDNSLIEQVVKKEKDVRFYLNIFLIVFAAVGIPAILVLIGIWINLHYMFMVAFFASLFCIYGLWFFISSLRVDYEYACLQSTMRFDKIIAKRRRKSIVKFDIKSISDFFRYSDEEMSKRKIKKVYRASAKEFSEDNYVAVFRNEARGQCAVIFTPNENILAAMKPYFNAELKKKLYFSKQS